MIDTDYTADNKSDGAISSRKGSGFNRKRSCRFCVNKEVLIDYKEPQILKYFITDRGKILPRRISGNCSKHQRKLALAIKRARMIALMPFVVIGH